ncbi:AAA family ATPase [uncultured Alcanivorax sp.]|uniref:AAA family ATPase n=1 Tax=uncultured Alcanivorax sp. TaxID=191215 RepID=UPI002619CDA7|nr:AAA family ATPase [uncultured Alcanivorax sp.]
MTLLNKILEWTQSCPSWQRDACRRLLQKEDGLDAVDFSELYTLLKNENGIDVDNVVAAVPLAKEHLPAEHAPGETVTLVALRDLNNINQIPNNHELTFSETGMTVIYGGNGSGKSGYARVMKRACRARDQSEPIHPNANDPAAATKEPRAKFDVIVSGTSEEIEWSRDETPPDRLSTISVFDSKCARSYITAEKDVAYLPYGLDILENLANQVIPKLAEKLEAEISGIDVRKLPFEHLLGDTEVGKVIEGLSEKSDAAAITFLGTVTEEETKRITELETALKETNPLAKAEEFRLSAMRLKGYAEKLSRPLVWVSDKAIEKLQKIDEEKNAAEIAEKKAAETLRSGEKLLPGTGDKTWKYLFEAARRYFTEAAYPGENFPASTDGKVCPLCQEDLPETANQRLKRFDEYIANDVAKTADADRQKVETAKSKIEAADLQVAADEALGDELKALDDSILGAITDFQASIEYRRESILNCLRESKWNDIPSLRESPRTRVRQLAADQIKAYRTLVRAADEENRNRLEKELNELSARKSLAKSLKAVIELLERMKIKAALEKCQLKTRPISDKSKEFASVAVTDELRKALDEEFKTLGIGHIKTKLKERSVRGKMFHQLLLDLPNTHKIDEILSEGEQRAVAIGSFFAELALANHSCGIVFDDPVSSLDHKRRGRVAKRMVREANTRQVIVFTHDVVFLEQLRTECKRASIEPEITSLERVGKSAGIVAPGLPWVHKSFGERIDALEKAQKAFEKLPWPAEPSEELAGEITRQYSFLRATIERVVQDHLLNGTVQRFRDYIEVKRLAEVVGLQQKEVDELFRLNQRCHDVVEAHDPASAKEDPPPTPDELKQDIADLRALVDAVKARRKAAKTTL